MIGSSNYKVFVSHASADVGVAKMLHALVTNAGADCYVDAKDLRGGVIFREELAKHIRSSNEMVVLLSPKFENSKWLDYEVGIAVGAGKLIVPLLFDLPRARISDFDFLRHLHAIHIDDHEVYLSDLKHRIRDGRLNKGVEFILSTRNNIERAFGPKRSGSDE